MKSPLEFNAGIGYGSSCLYYEIKKKPIPLSFIAAGCQGPLNLLVPYLETEISRNCQEWNNEESAK